MSFNPIFIIGCQRSGTTFLSSLLSVHEEVEAIPEGQFFVDCMPNDIHSINVIDVLNKIKNHYRFQIWNTSIPNISKDIASYENFVKSFVFQYLKNCNPSKKLGGIRYWIDHQPGHVRHMARLNEIFPKCKTIHIVRDGRAVANSIMPLDWGPNTITRAAYFWEQRIAHGFSAHYYLGDSKCLLVRYEDLLTNTVFTLKKICSFLEIEFDDNMLKADGFSVPKFTKAQHSLVGTGVNINRLDSWKHTLSQREIEIFESITNDLLVYLGYEKKFEKPRTVNKIESLKYDFEHILKTVHNKKKFKDRFLDSQK